MSKYLHFSTVEIFILWKKNIGELTLINKERIFLNPVQTTSIHYIIVYAQRHILSKCLLIAACRWKIN